MSPRQGMKHLRGRQARQEERQQRLPLEAPGQPTTQQVASWFLEHHVKGPSSEMGLSTRRGYKSTLRRYVEHFGPEARPTVGETRDWLWHRLAAGEVTALTANSDRQRLHCVYSLYRDQERAVTLNPFTWKRFRQRDMRHLKGMIENMDSLWPKLLEAMPDDRARAFLSILRRMGWRPGEVLGLEWRHIQWSAQGGPAVELRQQRRDWEDVPGELKHGAQGGVYKLHPETAEYLRRAQRTLREKGPAAFRMGCARGSLLGMVDCKDSASRQYVFPYRDDHTLELKARLRAAAPAEFPDGQAFYRFRRHFGVEMVKVFGTGERGRELVKKFMRHLHSATSDSYIRQVMGVQATGQDMEELYRAQDGQKVLSADGKNADNTSALDGSENQQIRRM